MTRALITGITGQDGLYLGELLTAKGYEVFGTVLDPNDPGRAAVADLLPDATLIDANLFHEKLQEWEDHYNYDRPHGGLAGQTPYERLRQKIQDPLS